MPTSNGELWRGFASCVLLWTLMPGVALAQRLVSVVPFSSGSVTMNASARHIVNDTVQALVPDDTDGLVDLYVHAVATGTVRRLPRLQLVGVPEGATTALFEVLSLSDDGRYLAYVTRRSGNDALQLPPVLARYDMETGARVVVRDAAVDVFRNPSMSRDGSSFAWVGANNAVHVATVGQAPLVVGAACPADDDCASRPALTLDGSRVLYLVTEESFDVTRLEVFDRRTGMRTLYPEAASQGSWQLITDAGGRYAAIFGVGNTSRFFDLTTRRVEDLPTIPSAISSDGRYLLVHNGVYDRQSTSLLGPGGDFMVAMSADGRLVLVRSGQLHLLLDLDGDADGMRDPWETVYGLDPGSSLDGALDADGDGVSNRDEYARGSHPRGIHRRYFAEGVSSSYLDTAMYVHRLANGSTPTTVTFFGDDGRVASHTIGVQRVGTMGEFGRIAPPPLLTSTQYAVLVESGAPFTAERLTIWGGAEPRGAHATHGGSPSTTWYFAEGATIGGLQLFYLLANPGQTDAIVTVRFVCAQAADVQRRYVVPAGRRQTVWVNQEGAPLQAAECGAAITSTQPIVAERSLYLTDGSGFTGGTAATGAPAAGHSWTVAEGATGSPFDMFLLLANPSAEAASVEVEYEVGGGMTLQRTYSVPAMQRVTVWVDQEDPLLSDSIVSARVQSSAPIVVERTMWWRRADGNGPWIEGHTELGATGASTRWAMAHVPESAELVIMNEGGVQGLAKVIMYAPLTGVGAAEAVIPLPPGRTIVTPTALFPALGPSRYSATVESQSLQGAPPVPIIVERVSYSPGRTLGTTFLATPVP